MAKVALLVGVSEYEPGLNPLPGSLKDVDAMHRVLAHPELGGFAETDITLLKNPQRQEMEEAIYHLFSNRKKDDLLLFYFSGHGIKDENNRLYLATRATRKDSSGRLVKPLAVAAASLHENINESRSQRQVIILDCCFSGAIAQGMTVKDDGTVNLKDYLGGKGRAILTSSTSTEYSFGSEIAGHENSGLSIYTRYLVEGIEKGAADSDGDGWIAVEELHEYAANRVKEASPAMTPKFYPVEEGYKIVLARSRKDDPKLKYRKEAQTWAERGQGQFSIIAERILEGKQIEWGIAAEEAKAIEDEVLQPYREYERKQLEYEQALVEIVQAGYPLSATAEGELKEYQQHLGLRDSDIAAVEGRILAPLKVKYERQLQEAEQLKQVQEKAEYENKIRRYEQEFTKAVQAEYPLNQSVINGLKAFQQQLELKDEDVAQIEKSIREPLDIKYQERLKQQQLVERQQQTELEKRHKLEQEKQRQEAEQRHQEREKIKYENFIQGYEQKFTKAVQKEYPLAQPVVDELKALQKKLQLKNEDITRVEQPIREIAEAKYQEKLKQLEQAEQRRKRWQQENRSLYEEMILTDKELDELIEEEEQSYILEIVKLLVAEVRKKDGIDLSTDQNAMQRLSKAATEAKTELSKYQIVKISIPYLYEAIEAPHNFPQPQHLDGILIQTKTKELNSIDDYERFIWMDNVNADDSGPANMYSMEGRALRKQGN